jgi:midasin (ATPase involved in ribosome maturation)
VAQAVTQGRWLVIEDVNLAPPDVLAALIPLLNSRELHLSQRGQTIQAAPTFQLLATVTCSPGDLDAMYAKPTSGEIMTGVLQIHGQNNNSWLDGCVDPTRLCFALGFALIPSPYRSVQSAGVPSILSL